jgi:hypothetical protein
VETSNEEFCQVFAVMLYKVFENRVLRTTFGPKRDEATEE